MNLSRQTAKKNPSIDGWQAARVSETGMEKV